MNFGFNLPSLAFCASFLKVSSFSSFSFCAFLRSCSALISTLSRDLRSAIYNASESLENASLTCTCCRPRPSAANLLSNGIV